MNSPRRRLPREVIRFAAAVVAVAGIIGGGAFIVLSQEATSEAQRTAEEVARVQGLGVVQPALTDGFFRGETPAVAEVDRVVRTRVLDDRTVRVKIWSRSGRILYSDESRLIGESFPLGPNEIEALETNRVDSYVSDLSRPENRFERSFGELLEVYLPLQSPAGDKVLFETYQEFASVQAQQRRMLLEFGPVLAGGLLLLLLFEAPLAWSMARRLEAAGRERELLLTRAIDASEGERRRIARDLHDGVVQRLAGTAMSLAAGAQRVDEDRTGGLNGSVSKTFSRGAADVREAVRELRTLIVKIAPTGLTAESLPTALEDLLEPLRGEGVKARLEYGDCALNPDEARLVFRVAQEAVRNAARHAEAEHLTVELSSTPGGRLLVVSDDGRGFEPGSRPGLPHDGHLGLALLKTLAEDAGATLVVRSSPNAGTRVEMKLP